MMKSKQLAQKLMEVMHPTVQLIRNETRSALGRQLTLVQFRTLAQITDGVTSMNALAKLQGVSQPSMSKVVDGLFNRNFIRRVKRKEDRRECELSLTRKGERALNAGFDSIHIFLAKRLERLNETERSTFDNLLDRLNDLFQKLEGQSSH